MIHIDIDDETQNISLLVKIGKVTPWDYANSQTEHELKKIRQAQEQLKRIKQEELQQQKQRKLRQQRNLKKQELTKVNYHKPTKDNELEV
ncbi:hypothetical protein [Limosilactobacillus reuteri]|uniref:hypothetical protein n=1 Tax=Limosilactobacillus reuteri TaxID=1598 RepID=UPI0017872126|nr:hypothetical protein [Limosilactobacillus reuteri]